VNNRLVKREKNANVGISLFGSAVKSVFDQILIFFFAKIECGLYFLNRFDVLISKMIFKK
jgi:hypothetical protein